MAQDTRQDEAKPESPPMRRAPYQRPGIAWEEAFEPMACSLDPQGCFGPGLPPPSRE